MAGKARFVCSELKKDWNDNLAAIFEAKLKAAMYVH